MRGGSVRLLATTVEPIKMPFVGGRGQIRVSSRRTVY